MSFEEFRNSDVRFDSKGFSFTIRAELRKKFRKLVRFAILGTGIGCGVGSLAMVVYALLKCEMLVPMLVCASIAGYTATVIKSR